MRFDVFGLLAALLFSVPSFAEEKGTLDRVYEGALKAAEKVFGSEEKLHKVDKNKQPQIIIKGNEMRYNGQLLELGDTFDNWVKVLGKPTRFSGDNVHIWDNLGIIIYLRDRRAGYTNKISVVSVMDIFFNFESRDQIFEHIPYFSPKNAFVGYLEIDGTGVDSTSKVWEVRATKDLFGDPLRHGFQRDHLPTIFRALSPPPTKLNMTFHTDRNGQYGVIYYLGVSQ